jgi:hypothetical protein
MADTLYYEPLNSSRRAQNFSSPRRAGLQPGGPGSFLKSALAAEANFGGGCAALCHNGGILLITARAKILARDRRKMEPETIPVWILG